MTSTCLVLPLALYPGPSYPQTSVSLFVKRTEDSVGAVSRQLGGTELAIGSYANHSLSLSLFPLQDRAAPDVPILLGGSVPLFLGRSERRTGEREWRRDKALTPTFPSCL